SRPSRCPPGKPSSSASPRAAGATLSPPSPPATRPPPADQHPVEYRVASRRYPENTGTDPAITGEPPEETGVEPGVEPDGCGPSQPSNERPSSGTASGVVPRQPGRAVVPVRESAAH